MVKKLWYIQGIEHKLTATKGEKRRGRDKFRVWDQQIQTTTCKIDKTRSYCTVQGTIFSILWWTIMEKNMKKNIYIYMLNHFALHQKWKEHCKPTILQFKKNSDPSVLLRLFSNAATARSLQSCPTLSDPMDCSLPGSSIHWIFQARVLEWVAIAFSCNCIVIHQFNLLLWGENTI